MSAIPEIRELTGLSHKKLAEWLGVSRSLLQFAENGERSLPSETLIKLNSILLLLKQLAEEVPGKAMARSVANPSSLAKLHRKKLSLHKKAANSLRQQLRMLEEKHPKLHARLELFTAIKDQRSEFFKMNKRDELWIEFAEFFVHADLDRTGHEKQELLREKIEMHDAYAALHKEREEKFVMLQQQRTEEQGAGEQEK